jgi:hypothetical protein
VHVTGELAVHATEAEAALLPTLVIRNTPLCPLVLCGTGDSILTKAVLPMQEASTPKLGWVGWGSSWLHAVKAETTIPIKRERGAEYRIFDSLLEGPADKERYIMENGTLR